MRDVRSEIDGMFGWEVSQTGRYFSLAQNESVAGMFCVVHGCGRCIVSCEVQL